MKREKGQHSFGFLLPPFRQLAWCALSPGLVLIPKCRADTEGGSSCDET